MLHDLLRYESGDMPEDEAASFEERLMTVPELRALAGWLDALPGALKQLARDVALVPILDEPGVAALRERARIEEFVLNAGDHHAAPLPDADFVLARVTADLASARRVDVEFCAPDGTAYFTVHEAPFTASGVIVACSVAVARDAGHLRLRVKDETGAIRADVELVNLPPQ